MTTLGQTLANRENAQKSTGPKTDEGKNAARMNALKHGLSADVVRVKGDDEAAFKEFADAYREELNPQTVAQLELAERIIVYVWKVRRAEAMETALWDSGGGTIGDMTVMLGTHAREIELCLRYGREAERKLAKAREEYRKLQTAALQMETRVGKFEAFVAQGKATQKRRQEEDYWAVLRATMEADMASSNAKWTAQKEGKGHEEAEKIGTRVWDERYANEILQARKRFGRSVGNLLTDSFYIEQADNETTPKPA